MLNRRYVGIIGFFFALAISAVPTYAKSPQFVVSWKPAVYAPVWYEGKLLPVVDSSVRVSFEAIDQNDPYAGKVIDISKREVRWYVGGNLVRKGIGLQTLTIQNKDYSGSPISLKIAFDFSDNETGERYFAEYFTSIPVVERKLLLVRRAMSNVLAPGAQATWYAVPLFFSSAPNASQIKWTVNGKPVSSVEGNPFALTVQAGDAGQFADVRVSISKSASLWENASAFERIIVQ